MQTYTKTSDYEIMIVYFNNCIPLTSEAEEELKRKYPIPLEFVHWDPEWEEEIGNLYFFHEQTLKEFYPQYPIASEIQLNFYFSIRDLYYFFTESFIEKHFRKTFVKKGDYIVKKRTHFGRFHLENNQGQKTTIYLHDTFGLSKGFGKLLELLDIDHPSKNILQNKSKMEEEATENTLNFMKYAIDDVYTLSQVDNALIKKINGILKLINIPASEHYMSDWKQHVTKRLPTTVGALVSKILKQYLVHQICEADSYTNFLINVQRFEEMNKQLSLTHESLYRGRRLKRLPKHEVFSDLLIGGNMKSFLFTSPNNTGFLNGICHGGRAFNEQPEEYLAHNLLDIDMQSCYGSALLGFSYPIGLPEVHAFSLDDVKPSLETFLNTYEHELVPNLYTIVVSGKLSFPQNLLYSKIVNMKNAVNKLQTYLMKEPENEDEEISEITGDFTVLTYELVNTVITSDILEILRKICTLNEIAEIMNLEVQTAAFYPKSKKLEKDQFVKEIQENPGSYTYSKEGRTNFDDRTRAWCEVPLSGIIKPLLNERKRLKQEGAKHPEKAGLYKNKQLFVKLIINTIYGVMASGFFSVGNSIVANNITGKARGYVW
eukprot:CAMPEP_0182426788 /NCGR_PEP_ID=MMETSP1167-20130531/13305_1 /TAXON_ID=2988 /ORGANISM="Mallomonas Sp, Strain CCMP3275" /LENGTH=600 /DNA_ID=CAMNT_0024608473 /DNA_START=92 /DNA_END=1891 /DNA_ORIENTATION=-